MADNKDYLSEKHNKSIAKLHELERLLPSYAVEFIYVKASKCKYTTILEYARDLLTFFRFLQQYDSSIGQYETCDIPIEVMNYITPDSIRDYRKYLKSKIQIGRYKFDSSDVTVRRRLSPVRSFFWYLLSRDKIDVNPVIAMEKTSKELERENSVLTMEDINQLIHVIDTVDTIEGKMGQRCARTKLRDKAIILLILNTGIKISECVGLDIEDIDLQEHSACILRKNGKTGFVYFNDHVREALFQYIHMERPGYLPESGDEHALFLSNRNKRMQVTSVHEMIVKYENIAFGDKIQHLNASMLRRTYGQYLYAATKNAAAVSKVLGVNIEHVKEYMPQEDVELRRLGRQNLYEETHTEKGKSR